MKYRFTLTMPDGAKSNVNVDESITMWGFLRLLLERGAVKVSASGGYEWGTSTVMRSAATYDHWASIPLTYLRYPVPEHREPAQRTPESAAEAYAQGSYEPKSKAVRTMLDELSREPEEWQTVDADPRYTGYTQADAERETRARFAAKKADDRPLRWQAGYVPSDGSAPVVLGSDATLEGAVDKAVRAMPDGVDSLKFIRVWTHPSFAETLNRPMRVDEVPEWMKVQKW